MGKKKIGIIMGGNSIESEFSVGVSELVSKSLNRLGYNNEIINVSTDLDKLLLHEIQFAFNLLYGCPGQDGAIQGMLEMLGIPYGGSGLAACALAKDKMISKRMFKENGVMAPAGMTVGREAATDIEKLNSTIEKEIGYPVVVKPLRNGGLSKGISIVKKKDELYNAVEMALELDEELLIERFASGLDFSVGITEFEQCPRLRPLMNIYDDSDTTNVVADKRKKKILEYDAVPERIIEKVMDESYKAFKAVLGEEIGYVDSIYDTKTDNVYIIEVGLVPGLSENSNIPLAAKKQGVSYDEIVEMYIDYGFKKYNLSKNDFYRSEKVYLGESQDEKVNV